MVGGLAAQGQKINVVGVVKDNDNKSIDRVSIRNNSNGINAYTNSEGEFSIRADRADTLVFSKIGYNSRYVLSEELMTIKIIIMEKSPLQIDEVLVNTGYQKLKPNQINGSVVTIDRQLLEKQVGTNVLDRLNGVSNGLTFQTGRTNTNPQNKLGITIRGYGTINGALDPLVVLDDFVYEGDTNNINPNDIESVTVLKDAEATSIYGARGGNGVIVLTSKKSKTDGKTRVDLNYNTMWKEEPDLSKLVNIENEDYIGLEEKLFSDGYFDNQLSAWNAPPVSPIVYWLNQKRKNNITEDVYLAYRKFYVGNDLKKEYANHFYKIANTQQVGFQLSGGDIAHNYILSLNQDVQKDNYGQPGNRTNIRIANSAKIVDWIVLNAAASYSNAKNESFNIPSFGSLTGVGERRSVSYLSLWNENGQAAPFYKYYGKTILDTVGKGRLLDWNYYPAQEADQNLSINTKKEFIGNVGLDLKLFSGGDLKLSYQRHRQDVAIEDLFGEESHYVRDRVNSFSQINESTGEVTYPLPKGNILAKSTASLETYAFRSQFNFHRKITDHLIMAMLGFETRETKSWGDNSMFFGYHKDPLFFASVDKTSMFLTKPFGSYNSIGGDPLISPTIVNRFVSMYGNFYYGWKEKYSLSGNIRKDGSNLFGVSANDKWKPLWSIGAGYEITKELFFEQTPFAYLKLKATLGYSGNVDLSRAALPITASLTNTLVNGGLPYGRIGTINNPSLRWEEVMQLNTGVEWRLKNIPLSGSFEYYIKNGNDLYGISSYDYTSWGATGEIMRNVAAIKGRGVDMQVTYSGGWNTVKWQSTWIHNYNKNRTKKSYYPYDVTPLSRLVSSSGSQINPVVGYPLYGLAAFVWKGLDNDGNPQGILNGEISTDYKAINNSSLENEGAIRFIGSAIPTHFGGWINTFRYKQFELSFNLSYKGGYYFRRNSFSSNALLSNGTVHPDYNKRWQSIGDKTDIPAWEYPLKKEGRDGFYASSEVLVEKADHVRLQFVNFAYNIKLSKWNMGSLQVFANVNNLGIVWRANKHNLDPDSPESIPLQKNYTVGLRANL